MFSSRRRRRRNAVQRCTATGKGGGVEEREADEDDEKRWGKRSHSGRRMSRTQPSLRLHFSSCEFSRRRRHRRHRRYRRYHYRRRLRHRRHRRRHRHRPICPQISPSPPANEFPDVASPLDLSRDRRIGESPEVARVRIFPPRRRASIILSLVRALPNFASRPSLPLPPLHSLCLSFSFLIRSCRTTETTTVDNLLLSREDRLP